MKKSSLSESSSDMMDLEDGVESTPGLLTTTEGGGGGRICSTAGGTGGGGTTVGAVCGNLMQDSMCGAGGATSGAVLAQTRTLAGDLQARITAPLLFSSSSYNNNDKQQFPQQQQQQHQSHQQQQSSCKPQSTTYCSLQRHNSALAVSIETDV